MKKSLLIILFFLLIQTSSYAKDALEYIHEEEGIHVYKIDTTKLGSKIKPYVADNLMTAQELYDTGKYDLVINGGFFDLKSGQEVSFITIDRKIINSPFNNSKLLSDLNNSGRLKEVLNRPELRIFSLPSGKYIFKIAPHFSPDADKIYLVHAIQAGPTLLPYYKPDLEGFIQYDDEKNVTFDSVSLQKRRARTIVGIKGKFLYLVIFSDTNKVCASEVIKYVKKQHYTSAIAFDGGWSTSLVTNDISIGSSDTNMRKVKSFLVIEK